MSECDHPPTKVDLGVSTFFVHSGTESVSYGGKVELIPTGKIACPSCNQWIVTHATGTIHIEGIDVELDRIGNPVKGNGDSLIVEDFEPPVYHKGFVNAKVCRYSLAWVVCGWPTCTTGYCHYHQAIEAEYAEKVGRAEG